MRGRREEVVEEKEKEKEKEKEEEKEEEVEEKEKKEKKEEEMKVEELVESTWLKRSTQHSIRRNGGRYTSFISDNRFQVHCNYM